MLSDIVRIYLIVLAFFSLTWTVVPIIPRYVINLGADVVTVGIVMSAAPLTTVVTRIVFSVISDIKSRNLALRLGFLFLCCSYLIYFLSNEVKDVILGRVLQGLAIASFVPASIACVTDLAKHGGVSRALGTRALMTSLGYTLGPFVGGFFSEYLSYKSLFLTMSLLSLMPIPFIKVRKDSINSNYTLSTLFKDLTSIIKSRVFILIFTSSILQTVILASIIPFLSTYLKVCGYSDLDAGIATSIYGLSGIFARLFMNLFSDRSVFVLAFLGLCLDLAGVLTLSLTPLPPSNYIPLFTLGFGDGIYVPATQALVLINSKLEIRSTLSGAFALSWDIGMIIGPIITGYLINATNDYPSSFRLLTLFTITSAILLYTIRKLSMLPQGVCPSAITNTNK